MSRIVPLPEAEAADKVAQTYARLRELLGGEPLPEPLLAMGRVPAFLHDFYMNFKKFVLGSGQLTERERLQIALAVSLNAGCDDWTALLRQRAGEQIHDDEYAELAAVVAACNMYNTFFKFRALSGSDLFQGMSIGLRAHTFSGTSLDERTIELVNTVVSNLNGCKPCTEGHVTKCRQLDIADEAILEAIQCGSVIQSAVCYQRAAR